MRESYFDNASGIAGNPSSKGRGIAQQKDRVATYSKQEAH